jgi:hypothetical protein
VQLCDRWPFRSLSTQETLDHCFAPIIPSWPSTPEIRVLYQNGVFSPSHLAWGSAPVSVQQITFVFWYKGVAIMRVAIYARVSSKGGR